MGFNMNYERLLLNKFFEWARYPLDNFYATPSLSGGLLFNIEKWNCVVPGLPGTPWEGGFYRFRLIFKKNLVGMPPVCFFDPIILHHSVNEYSGQFTCDFLEDGDQWDPNSSIKDILLGIQKELAVPIEDVIIHISDGMSHRLKCALYNYSVADQAKHMTKSAVFHYP